ncbi:MAG: GPR endopeptidase [Eubacteriales bacterium]|nr:GPR endopeptidase [Eubacteriales bacterium]MDD4389949.1 GPR endopeptidase [Eubacteriales bacterium]
MKYRTDLALESKQLYDEENKGKEADIPGVSSDINIYDEDIKVTTIEIVDERGAVALGKPPGKYITLEVEGLIDGKEGVKERASHALGRELTKLIPFKYDLKTLIVGIGNDKVTPDSLGPYTASKIKITRHLFLIYDADGDYDMSCVSGFIPGVMGSTGIETAEIIKKAIDISEPEVVVVIDSLAARDISRVNTTIQINDVGISPGRGMGNMRTELSKDTLGKRVIAIGVPTVIDASTLIADAMLEMGQKDDDVMKYVEDNQHDLVVTSTDIDLIIKDFSDIIANGINITLHPGIYK